MNRNPSKQTQAGIITALVTEWHITNEDAVQVVRGFFQEPIAR
jgi:hypothetical protein